MLHGGANARPFVTHINAYDMPLYLRIAPELYLKRLLVGGAERVFEINRNFRNEGADSSHNPEFTMLEMYQAYGDYDTVRVLTQKIIQNAATAVFGAPVARRVQEDGSVEEFDLSGDWPVKTMFDAVSEALGERIDLDTPMAKLRAVSQSLGLEEPGCGQRRHADRGDLRRGGGVPDDDPRLLPGLPQGERPAHPGPPQRPAAHGEVGPRRAGPRSRAPATRS